MTVGQLIDEWLHENDSQYETVYFYYDKNGDGHIVVTKGVAVYDWQDILTDDINLSNLIKEKQNTVKSLQSKINSKDKDLKSIEKAIRKLVEPFNKVKD